eukprot:scaffold106_cov109-Isochrysis_galbana.AAC.9
MFRVQTGLAPLGCGEPLNLSVAWRHCAVGVAKFECGVTPPGRGMCKPARLHSAVGRVRTCLDPSIPLHEWMTESEFWREEPPSHKGAMATQP